MALKKMTNSLVCGLIAAVIAMPLLAGDGDVVVEHKDGSWFQRDDVFNAVANGQGQCKVSGSRDWQGGCGVEQFANGELNRFDIYLNDGTPLLRVESVDGGGYSTLVDGKPVPTTVEHAGGSTPVFVIGAMTIHASIEKMKLRKDTPDDPAWFSADSGHFQIMARGTGQCQASGGLSYSGACTVEQLQGGDLHLLKGYDISFQDDNTRYQLRQSSKGATAYKTRVNGADTDVNSTIEDLSKTESVLNIGDTRIQFVLQKLTIRSGP